MPNNKYECLKLDNQLCFPLYAASREVVKRYSPYLEKLDLTYTQYITMMVRARSKTDERNLIVSLTEKGEALKDKAVDVPTQMASCLNLDQDEVTQLYTLLHKLLGTEA